MLERGALPMSLPCGFESRLVQTFQRNIIRCCVLGHGISPSNAPLDSGENEYLVGQRWHCVQ